jgi:predicted Zn-dependent protease
MTATKLSLEPINRRPLHVLYPTGVKGHRRVFVESAIKDLLKSVPADLPGENFYKGRADEIMRLGRDNARRDEDGDYQVDAAVMIDKISSDVWRSGQDRYELLVTTIDLYAPDLNFMFGVSAPQLGCVFSFKRFREAGVLAIETAKTVLMHELGHTFGLPGATRTKAIEESLGRHCTRKDCIMRQGLTLDEFISHTRDRLRAGKALCALCEEDLVRQFWRKR